MMLLDLKLLISPLKPQEPKHCMELLKWQPLQHYHRCHAVFKAMMVLLFSISASRRTSQSMNISFVDAMISIFQKSQRTGENKFLNTLPLRTGTILKQRCIFNVIILLNFELLDFLN